MGAMRIAGIIALMCMISGLAHGADMILNEYNAVASDSFLNGGDAAADKDGGHA